MSYSGLYFSCDFFFFFNDTATTEIYTLSLHDALPIWRSPRPADRDQPGEPGPAERAQPAEDRKSTRLNSSHTVISYAVFCLKKKKNKRTKLSQLKDSNTRHMSQRLCRTTTRSRVINIW